MWTELGGNRGSESMDDGDAETHSRVVQMEGEQELQGKGNLAWPGRHGGLSLGRVERPAR